MRGILVFAATLLLGFGLVLAHQTPGAADDKSLVAAACPYVPAYGTVYDTDGNEVVEDEADRPKVLMEVLTCAAAQLDAAQTARYLASIGPVISDVADPVTTTERLLLRTELAAAISTNATVRQQEAVARRVSGYLRDPDVIDLANRYEFLKTLRDNGWKGLDQGSVSHDREGEYIAQCRAAGVPVPPPIGTVGGGWSAETPLKTTPGDWMLSSPKPAVWTYTDGDGFCIALRRGVASTVALGTICSDMSQQHACFFDSLVYDDQGKVRSLSEAEALTTDYSRLVHPEDIVNRCDGCHVGANPFIVNPHAPLGQLVRSLYSVKPSPFTYVGANAAGWWNPPFFKAAPFSPESECISCHDLPGADTGSYCDRILHRAAGWFMPPKWADHNTGPKVNLWPDSKTGCPPIATVPPELQDYVKSVHALAQMCRPNEKIPDCPLFQTGTTAP